MTTSFDNTDLLAAESDLPGIQDVQILLHVGPQKTGSTWLQNRLFPTHEGLIFSSDFRLTHRAFLIPRYGEFSLVAVADIFGSLLDEARKTGKPLVLSDEALGGRPYGQKYFREVAAFRIKRAFPKVKLLTVSRRQDQILSSLYCEYLRTGHSSTLAGFLDQDTGNPNIEPIIDMAFFEWDRSLRFYQSVFGAEAVTMLPMEQVVGDGAFVTAALERILDLRFTVPPSEQMQIRERPSWSGWAMNVLRRCNRLVANDSRHRSGLRRLSPTSVAWQVDRITPAFARKRGAQAQSTLICTQLGDRFASSNARYAQMTGTDLDALGYRM